MKASEQPAPCRLAWEGCAGRLGFENAGGCLPLEGASCHQGDSQLKVSPQTYTSGFLPGPLKRNTTKKGGGGLAPVAHSGQIVIMLKGQRGHSFDLMFT